MPDFDDDCTWPRRLLHIPTMISVHWTPGNCYGSDREPRYIAISYTWGRWRLKGPTHPEVKGLAVNGVTWEMPRVDPAHFSTAEMENILGSALKLSAEIENFNDPGKSLPPINYLWLDVACIDQTRGSVEMASEVGRQAKIFRGATHTFAWLTKLSRQEYLSQSGRHQELAKPSRAEAKSGADKVRRGLDINRLEIEQLSLDPWFSSLWTLQEAYLCPQAMFITRQGELLSQSDIETPAKDPMLLSYFIDYCDHMLTIVTAHEKKPQTIAPDDRYLLALKQSLERSGMVGLRSTLPITLLGAARYRTTTRVTDRVYGIMQVFGFRLGKSKPGCNPNVEIPLQELEDELGQELLIREPVMSQMHVFEGLPQVGKGWRISQDSRPTRRLHLVNHTYGDGKSVFEDISTKAQLSTIALDGITWGYFNGKTCKFTKLVEIWDSDKGWGGGIIDLDGLENWTAVHGPDIAREEALTFSQKHPDAVVLLLGLPEGGASHASSRMPIGLLLVPFSRQSVVSKSVDMWQRAGVCQWWTSHVPNHSSEVVRTLEGESGDWILSAGAFG
ncbi:hypothetical protein CORC01_00532 [Colletotrichum orchidophilum]|uniref:Heterokaryon incompatibility domain-containing protein n=1 Tax=Colletotrichum orchidophilum TaxID=1209926 RepID=A0A1G4BS33_9PEZI|nr:uncharacterized protein CORC01_00532 [Colletotrichum orchidophilum]OHF04193.1 hypothetical protein CORC01_00532 [Colletotrichum orchidophilum]